MRIPAYLNCWTSDAQVVVTINCVDPLLVLRMDYAKTSHIIIDEGHENQVWLDFGTSAKRLGRSSSAPGSHSELHHDR